MLSAVPSNRSLTQIAALAPKQRGRLWPGSLFSIDGPCSAEREFMRLGDEFGLIRCGLKADQERRKSGYKGSS